MGSWIELLRNLGEALLEVLRAEAAALASDLRASGHHLWVGLLLLGAAAGIGFWLLGVLVFTVIAVLAIWLPTWAAALATAGLFAAGAGLLVALGVARLRRLESPMDSARRRVADHLDWWQRRLLADPPPVQPAIPVAGSARAGDEPGGRPRSPGDSGDLT